MTAIDGQRVELPRPLSPLIGARTRRTRPLPPPRRRRRAPGPAALNTHHVVFRDQELSPAQQADFARQFGTPTEGHPVIPALEAVPKSSPSTAARTGPAGGTPT